MKFRKAKKNDISKMLEIIKINSPKYPKKIANKEISEMFSQSLHKPIYIVAEEKKEIVAFGGFIRSWIDSIVFNIFWINTNPKYKNKGLGNKLVKELIKEIKSIKEKPKTKMIIISTKIPSFYKKFGFKKITSKYDRDYILMSLNI